MGSMRSSCQSEAAQMAVEKRTVETDDTPLGERSCKKLHTSGSWLPFCTNQRGGPLTSAKFQASKSIVLNY